MRHSTIDYGLEVTPAMPRTVCPRTMGTNSLLWTGIMTRHLNAVHVHLPMGVGGGSTGIHHTHSFPGYGYFNFQTSSMLLYLTVVDLNYPPYYLTNKNIFLFNKQFLYFSK